jgi:hypothetical protein
MNSSSVTKKTLNASLIETSVDVGISKWHTGGISRRGISPESPFFATIARLDAATSSVDNASVAPDGFDFGLRPRQIVLRQFATYAIYKRPHYTD